MLNGAIGERSCRYFYHLIRHNSISKWEQWVNVKKSPKSNCTRYAILKFLEYDFTQQVAETRFQSSILVLLPSEICMLLIQSVMHNLKFSRPGKLLKLTGLQIILTQFGIESYMISSMGPTKTGFHIHFENRLPSRATTTKLRLPDNIFWLPDNTNVKRYSKTFGCPIGQPGVNFWFARQEEMVAPGNWLCETLQNTPNDIIIQIIRVQINRVALYTFKVHLVCVCMLYSDRRDGACAA